MSNRIRLFCLALGWAGATFGVLAIERIPGDYAHGYCGPWGCLPPLQALVAIHGFWLMMLLPPTSWLIARASPPRLWATGVLVFWIGIFGLTLVAGRGLTSWLDTAGEFRRYAGQRFLYLVVTTTDLPFCQLALAGLVLWLVGRHRDVSSRSPVNGETSVTAGRSGDRLQPSGHWI
jgi:hypothetical protein